MTVPSVENFATSQNWLFVAEVCNTVWCGQIKENYLSNGAMRLIFSNLVI